MKTSTRTKAPSLGIRFCSKTISILSVFKKKTSTSTRCGEDFCQQSTLELNGKHT